MPSSVACLCGQVVLPIALKASSKLHLCHCHRCRAVSGLLCSAYYFVQQKPPALTGLREYRQSDHASRFFCRRCGAHVFARSAVGEFLVAAGVLAAENTPPVSTVQHWQVTDTGDGGLSTFLAGTISPTPGCLLSAGQSDPPSLSTDTSNNADEVQARCDCGGIDFYITPPDTSSVEASSPWADLLVPFHSASSANPDDVKWWLRDGNTKYLAGTCACTSCRLGSGFPIQTWAFIPKSNLWNADRSPLTFTHGSMQRYNSSPGVYREFCSRCGANVFWHCDERPSLIDVSVGLLRSRNVRAEELLDWATGRVSFAEMGVQQDLVRLLEDGLKVYGESKQ
ncbi:uncharacterized protein PFLUO_LOCUS2722 [Penicillium psychrofluorescens]|uniref:uncharacterized protein n=1 Tax=Penicillium psychrofluorescens TaxID=3158075 RepID=UPI003CCE4E16